MKTFGFIAGAISLAASIFTACATVPKKSETVIYEGTKGGAPVEVTIEKLQAKSTCTVSLFANPTTGYSWSYYLTPDKVICISDEKYLEDEKKEGMTGAGGKQYYTFQGLKQGIADAVLTYSRPWEKKKSAQKIRIKFSIDKNLNVSVQSVEEEAD